MNISILYYSFCCSCQAMHFALNVSNTYHINQRCDKETKYRSKSEYGKKMLMIGASYFRTEIVHTSTIHPKICFM